MAVAELLGVAFLLARSPCVCSRMLAISCASPPSLKRRREERRPLQLRAERRPEVELLAAAPATASRVVAGGRAGLDGPRDGERRGGRRPEVELVAAAPATISGEAAPPPEVELVSAAPATASGAADEDGADRGGPSARRWSWSRRPVGRRAELVTAARAGEDPSSSGMTAARIGAVGSGIGRWAAGPGRTPPPLI